MVCFSCGRGGCVFPCFVSSKRKRKSESTISAARRVRSRSPDARSSRCSPQQRRARPLGWLAGWPAGQTRSAREDNHPSRSFIFGAAGVARLVPALQNGALFVPLSPTSHLCVTRGDSRYSSCTYISIRKQIASEDMQTPYGSRAQVHGNNL